MRGASSFSKNSTCGMLYDSNIIKWGESILFGNSKGHSCLGELLKSLCVDMASLVLRPWLYYKQLDHRKQVAFSPKVRSAKCFQTHPF